MLCYSLTTSSQSQNYLRTSRYYSALLSKLPMEMPAMGLSGMTLVTQPVIEAIY